MPLIGNIQINNTANLIGPWVRLCACLWAPPKFGKTKWAAALDKVTRRWYNKKTLVIAVEAADGGGTMSIREEGVDYVEPASWSDFTGIVAALQGDTTYGGVVLDNASDLVKRYIQPEAIKLPYEKGTPPASRLKGVPAQGDYQTMGEMLRTELNKLVNMTKKAVPEDRRKHLIVTALQYEKMTRNGAETISIGPALPGQMADTASEMFQTILTIEVDRRVEVDPQDKTKTKGVSHRIIVSEADGKKILGDRMNIFPKRGEFDLVKVWEQYWLPACGMRVDEAKVTTQETA